MRTVVWIIRAILVVSVCVAPVIVLADTGSITVTFQERVKGYAGSVALERGSLLCAAVVFATAGMDAALKRLPDDTLPGLPAVSSQAHEKFEVFAVGQPAGRFVAIPGRPVRALSLRQGAWMRRAALSRAA